MDDWQDNTTECWTRTLLIGPLFLWRPLAILVTFILRLSSQYRGPDISAIRDSTVLILYGIVHRCYTSAPSKRPCKASHSSNIFLSYTKEGIFIELRAYHNMTISVALPLRTRCVNTLFDMIDQEGIV